MNKTNRLIIPKHSVDAEKGDLDINNLMEEVYTNSLKFFEDKKENKDDLLPASIFLYSFGDKKIYEDLVDDKTRENKQINNDKIKLGNKYIKEFQSEIISAVQFRLKDRKLILDLNLYKKDMFEKQLNKSYPRDGLLTHLILNTFNEKLIYDTKDINKTRMDLSTAISNIELNDTCFSGIIDNVSFQEKIKKDVTVEATDIQREKVSNFNEYSLDGYFKVLLKEWKRKLELSSNLASNSNIYPKIEVLSLDSDDRLSILVVNPADENFIDDKTDESDQVFECSWFMFENIFKDNKKDLNIFTKEMESFISRFLKECFTQNLQTNINVSTGEAADIARYWYREGVPKLFSEKSENATDIDVLDFYEKFIKDMLCEIEGIEETEIFPFDRVFIFPNTAVDDIEKQGNDIENAIVLEAHIKSLHPEDKGGYISSWEGIAEDNDKPLISESDLKFSKKILSKFVWNNLKEVNRAEDFGETINEESKKPIFEKLNSILHKDNQHIDSNLLVGALRLSNKSQRDMADAEKNKLEQYKRDIRTKYKDGIYYTYDFGISLKDEFPMLYDLQNLYFSELYNIYSKRERTLKDSRRDVLNSDDGFYNLNDIQTDKLPSEFRNKDKVKIDSLLKDLVDKITNEFKSKVIVVSFNPEDLKNEDESKLLANQKFTMIFVADFDLIKTNGELTAETKDMEVLLNMIIRQLTNDEKHKKAINKAITEQNKKIKGTLDSAVHNIKSFINDTDTKKKIDVVLNEAMKRLEDAQSENVEEKEFNENDIYSNILNSLLHNDSKGNLSKQIESYEISIDDIQIIKNYTALPKLVVKWDEFYIREAFNVMLKNSVEYTSEYAKTTKYGNIILNMSISTINNNDFLTISIINNMKGISKKRFDQMNDESVERIGKDNNKDGSTGIGVAQSRIQLKGINEFHNIKFHIIDKHTIECCMVLKIEKIIEEEDLFILDNNHNNEVQIRDEDFKGILYFEDAVNNYESTIEFLTSQNIEHQHFERKVDSYMDNATMLITDMSILNEHDEPDSFQGLEAIRTFKELSKQNSPICVFSDGMAATIQNDIAEHLDISKDKILIVNDDMYNITIENSYIYVVNNTKILSSKHKMIMNYIKINKEIKTIEKTIVEEKSYKHSNIIHLLDDELEYTSEFKQQLQTLEYTIQDKYFYVVKQYVQDIELKNILKKWFEFKTERSNQDGRRYSISKTTYHKNILLIINDIVVKDIKEKPWLFYFGITYNIFFNFSNLSEDKVMEQWSQIASKRESTGYLGKLRHDIKNFNAKYSSIEGSSDVSKYIDSIINTTESLQTKLKRNQYESLEVYIENDQHNINYNINVKKEFELIMESIEKVINFFNGKVDEKKLDDLKAFNKIVELNYQVCI